VQGTRYRINDELTAAKVFDDEVIVIHVATGRYYDLEGVGAEVWTMIGDGATAGEIAAGLAATYDVEEGTAREDVERLLESLRAEDLVAADGASLPAKQPAEASAQAALRPYEPPRLTTYTDMEDLLAADPPMPAPYTSTEADPPST
jgi:hypothetical protein